MNDKDELQCQWVKHCGNNYEKMDNKNTVSLTQRSSDQRNAKSTVLTILIPCKLMHTVIKG